MKDSRGSFTLLGEFNQAATRENADFACMSGSVGLMPDPSKALGLRQVRHILIAVNSPHRSEGWRREEDPSEDQVGQN